MAAPDLVFGVAFLVTWVRPFTFGQGAVGYFMLTMLLEFLVVHSAAFMGVVVLSDAPKLAKVRNTLLLGSFYTVFAGAFSLAFKRWWPLVAFWVLTLNRLLGGIVGHAPSGRERLYIRAGWAMGAILFLAAAGLTTMLPVPAFGVTRDVRALLDLPGSGQWIDEPQRVLAFGFVYFTATAFVEWFGVSRASVFLRGIPGAHEAAR